MGQRAGSAQHYCSSVASLSLRCTVPVRRVERPLYQTWARSQLITNNTTSWKKFTVSQMTVWMPSSILSAGNTFGIRERLFVEAAGSWPMVTLLHYVGTGWLQIGRVVAIAFMEFPFTLCISLGGGFSLDENGSCPTAYNGSNG